MEKEKHIEAHKAAAEILKAAEKADKGFHYILLTTHEDSETTTRNMAASEKTAAQMLTHFSPEILHRVLGVVIQEMQK